MSKTSKNNSLSKETTHRNSDQIRWCKFRCKSFRLSLHSASFSVYTDFTELPQKERKNPNFSAIFADAEFFSINPVHVPLLVHFSGFIKIQSLTYRELSKKKVYQSNNDIRDKIADIGRFLGFSAEVEKKIAIGAIVDTVGEVTIGNMGHVIYVFEVQTSGSIDSPILNLDAVKNNKAVQGIIAVTDQKQIEKIKKEIATLSIKEEVKFWDYEEVLKVHESLQFANESINNLGLTPLGF